MNDRPQMKSSVSSALRPFGTSIFSEMTALANEHGAVNLSQGFPDFDGPYEIRQLAAEAVLHGPNQYVSSIGIAEFRRAVAAKLKRFYGVDVDADHEVTVTAGATEGLCATLLGLLEPGDEVILLEPAYDSYAPLASLARAQVKHVSLTLPDFALPHQELAAAFSAKTKAIVINNPQNPCGKVFSRDELEFIAELCRQHNAYAIGDEVYEHLVYDDGAHHTLLTIPEFRDRALVVSSTAKTFSMTGWKVGYVIAAPHLTEGVRMSHQFITFCGQHAFQQAMAAAIELPDTYYSDLLEDYAAKRKRLSQALSTIGFNVLQPQGTYYILADITPLGFDDDLAFCRELPATAGVAAIPCSCFWKDRRAGRNLVRFCFCKRDEILDEAMDRLRRRFG